MIKIMLSMFRSPVSFNFALVALLFVGKAWSQTTVTRIHTDSNGYWTAAAATGIGNRPDKENNLLGFTWNGTTYSTGANDATLTSNSISFSAQKFQALTIQSLGYKSDSYYLQGSMIDGSATNRLLTPPLSGSTSTQSDLISRLTDGLNGLSLGTSIANIAKNSVYFKIGTNNLNTESLNDGIPDLIVTQVAQPTGADVYKFVDTSGNLVGNVVNINFNSVPVVGSYSLDIFNSSSGKIVTNFKAGEIRDIRILGIEISSFGINASNVALVDRLVVTFSGGADCAFIALNTNSLKKGELSLITKAELLNGSSKLGDKIEYTFDVKNTGTVPVNNVTVIDPLQGIEITGIQGSTLAVGATITLHGTYIITTADVNAGSVTNSAKVTGVDTSLTTIVDISGQTNTDDIPTITYLLTPPLGITGTTKICNGDSTTLTLSGPSVKPGIITEWFAGTCGGTPISIGTNSITISPTSDTTYYVRYTDTLGNTPATSCVSQVISVVPSNSITLSSDIGTDNQYKSINTPITPITYVIAEATEANVVGLPAGVTASFTSNILTISGTLRASGIYNYSVNSIGSCGTITGKISTLCEPIVGIIKTAFSSSKSESFNKNNCGANGTGSAITYSATAISTISQADADLKAQNAVNTGGQAYANSNGTCSYSYSSTQSGSFNRNNCGANGTGSVVTYSATANSTISQADADSKAMAAVNAGGQAYANTNGSCTYSYTSTKSGLFTRNNCGSGYTGSTVTFSANATSTISQADADSRAQNAVNNGGQNYANIYGVCTEVPPVDPPDDCVCQQLCQNSDPYSIVETYYGDCNGSILVANLAYGQCVTDCSPASNKSNVNQDSTLKK